MEFSPHSYAIAAFRPIPGQVGRFALLAAVLLLISPIRASIASAADTFCLQDEFDLGSRLQGLEPAAGEFYPERFCVTTEAGGSRWAADISARAGFGLMGWVMGPGRHSFAGRVLANQGPALTSSGSFSRILGRIRAV
jgi:hypothetical protein